MIRFAYLQPIEWLAVGVLALSFLSAVLLWRRERRSRAAAADLLQRADAELEGRRLLDEGWRALRQGEAEQAERLLRRAVRLYEELGDPALIGHARYRLAILYRIGGELDRAIRTLKPAVELNSPLPQPYLFLARSYERAGRFDRAEQVLKAARRHCGRLSGVTPWLRLLKDKKYRDSVSMNSGKHLASSLSELPGVGKKTTAALIELGLDGVPLLANARAEELTVIPHLGEATAVRIIEEARQQVQELGRRRKKESNHV